MEIIDYVGSDGFVHHIINNTMGIPFFFYVLIIGSSIGFILLVLKKLLG